jgi:cytochrome c oxidase subunit 4
MGVPLSNPVPAPQPLEAADMNQASQHHPTPRTYIGVLSALMALLVLTVVMAFVDLDHWTRAHHLGSGANTAIALSIAVIKGLLIALIFMHVRYSSHLTWVFASAGFVWLAIMLTLTMTDYLSRNHPAGSSPKGEPTYISQGMAR